jgi:crotonobetainyl-CoA:carnitine CoA-transferase CaiB-like acyl-CoA transferase
MALGALEPTFFGRFCELAGRPELAASQYARGEEAVAVHRELEQLFESRTSAVWMELCDGHDVCLEVVRTPAEAAADPEFSDVVRDVGGFTVVSAHVGGSTPAPTRPPSQLGADVAAVVARVGLDQAVVDAAVAAGALLWPEAGG